MNIRTSTYFKFLGIVIGAIGLVLLVSRHPVIVSFIALGAGAYFTGEYLKKQGD